MEKLSKRLGTLPLVLFWLALEYIALSVNMFTFFLADLLSWQSEWLRWTRYTGYLGTSFWILIVLLLLYFSFFRNGFKWSYLVVCVIVIVGPILYSYTLQVEPVTKMEMIRAYAISLNPVDSPYAKNGEWVARTAAWISVLVLLSAVVKEFVRKK